jgi:acyl-coenzyme A thioesterase PaaI-like protein
MASHRVSDADTRRAYSTLIDAMRAFQDALAGSSPPADVSEAITADLTRVVELLEPHSVAEEHQLFNRIPETPGHAQSLTPKLVIDDVGAGEVQGRVSFTRFHLGGGSAAHGGAISLLFDSLLGRLANWDGRPRARTAHLEVDYRQVTPMDTELKVHGRIVREAGRKRYLTGTLAIGEKICAEANGIWVQLLPGQQ